MIRFILFLLFSLPKIRAAVEKIQKELETKDAFELLAAEGKKAGADSSMLLSAEFGAHPTGFFGKAWSISNLIRDRLTGAIDAKLAAEIGTELARSDTAAKAMTKASTREQRVRMVTTPAKAVAKTTVNMLKSPVGIIGYQQQNQYSIITINNWSKFQHRDTKSDQETSNTRPSCDQKMTTNNNDNKEKNDKEKGVNYESLSR